MPVVTLASFYMLLSLDGNFTQFQNLYFVADPCANFNKVKPMSAPLTRKRKKKKYKHGCFTIATKVPANSYMYYNIFLYPTYSLPNIPFDSCYTNSFTLCLSVCNRKDYFAATATAPLHRCNVRTYQWIFKKLILGIIFSKIQFVFFFHYPVWLDFHH